MWTLIKSCKTNPPLLQQSISYSYKKGKGVSLDFSSWCTISLELKQVGLILNLSESTVLVCNNKSLRCRGKHSIFQMFLHIHDRFSEICFEFPKQTRVSFLSHGLHQEIGGFIGRSQVNLWHVLRRWGLHLETRMPWGATEPRGGWGSQATCLTCWVPKAEWSEASGIYPLEMLYILYVHATLENISNVLENIKLWASSLEMSEKSDLREGGVWSPGPLVLPGSYQGQAAIRNFPHAPRVWEHQLGWACWAHTGGWAGPTAEAVGRRFCLPERPCLPRSFALVDISPS